MQNYNNNQNGGLEISFVNWLMTHSALILVIAAVTSFFITGLIEFFYYTDIFNNSLPYELMIFLSVLFAIFFQGVRCASLASTAKMFSSGEKLKGTFVLLISLGVTIFCGYEAGRIAAVWEHGNDALAGHLKLPILAAVVAGWMLELILVVNVSAGRQRPAAAPGSAAARSNGREYAGSQPDDNFFANT